MKYSPVRWTASFALSNGRRTSLVNVPAVSGAVTLLRCRAGDVCGGTRWRYSKSRGAAAAGAGCSPQRSPDTASGVRHRLAKLCCQCALSLENQSFLLCFVSLWIWRLEKRKSFAPCFAVNFQLAASRCFSVHFTDFLAP